MASAGEGAGSPLPGCAAARRHKRSAFTREVRSQEECIHKRSAFTREVRSQEECVHKRSAFTRVAFARVAFARVAAPRSAHWLRHSL